MALLPFVQAQATRRWAYDRHVATLTGISPVLLVADLERSVAYYRDRLGFECHVYGDPPNFATADRDAATILLALANDRERLVPHWRIVDMMWNAYIRVDDVDAIYAEVQERGAGIDYTIYNAPHGFREFGVQDPDGHDIAFGQPIAPEGS
jgi:catechol 2,3-dioxygenase-like lactoylglutathione lyase family enzyme